MSRALRRASRGLTLDVGLLLLLSASASVFAQPALRKATTLDALVTYPLFYQGQPVLVRGILTTNQRGPVFSSPEVERTLRVIFRGTSPPDGPVELRGEFWDIGRLHQDDPRVEADHLLSVLPEGPESQWPRPGEVFALAVSDAATATPLASAPTLRSIVLEPAQYVGRRVTVSGQFRGRNLFGDLPQAPGVSQWDFVLRSADAALWVTGTRPRGQGFDLGVGARVDTGHWLEVSGVVKRGRGLVWLEQTQLTLSKPPEEPAQAEAPARPPAGPAAEVIFTDPSEGETDVPLTKVVRIQFSRDMKPETFKGLVKFSYLASEAFERGEPESPAINATPRYDRANRSLELRFAEPLARFRTLKIELLDGITATDGASLKPWTLTFVLGGS